ncbi:MAG TPA: DUF1572 family protein [Gemmatimonadaceae bacterium]|nr:DUF1572 family protein [Gemmatimonadaceae bacterium]
MDPAIAFLSMSREYLGIEYPTKLRAAVQALPANALWWRANDQSNSVGNLLLHLDGNVRQWIVRGVGSASTSAPGERDRAGEFAAQSGPSASELLARLEGTLREADAVLAALTPDALPSGRVIQGEEVTVLEAIYHVVEHFSLHLGQIIWAAKMHAPGAIRFYDDAGGLARPRWPELR